MGKRKTDEYNTAYDLFCNTDMQRKQIAKVASVSEQQLGKWIKDDDWELDKEAKSVTKEKLVIGLYKDIAEIRKTATLEKRSLLPVESDQIVKLSNSIQAQILLLPIV